MAHFKASIKDVYDYVVVGSGLSGLLVAHGLIRSGKKVAIVESKSETGGRHRSFTGELGPYASQLPFLFDRPMTQSAIEFLKDSFGWSLQVQGDESPPVSLQNGSLSEYVGLGSTSAPDFYGYFQDLTSKARLKEEGGLGSFVSHLVDTFTGDLYSQSIVTRINVCDQLATSLTINGGPELRCENVIFSGAPKDLLHLLAGENLSGRARQKLAKSPTWTTLNLDLSFSQKVSENLGLHILVQKDKKEQTMVAGGGFFAPTNEGRQHSLWTSFISDEEAENAELTGNLIRKMKRQIFRIYPEFKDAVIDEKVRVIPSGLGTPHLPLKENQSIENIKNLWVSSGAIHDEQGPIGSILQARKVLSAVSSEFFSSPQLSNTDEIPAQLL